MVLVGFSLIIPQRVGAQESDLKVSTKLQPEGPLNPGQAYTLKVNSMFGGVACDRCLVKAIFEGDSQPLDTIDPVEVYTDKNGIAYINITSYAPISRQVLIETRLLDGKAKDVQPIDLRYNNNPFLSVTSMIKKILDVGIPLPPMGNPYPQITHQNYTDGLTRTIYIKTNQPFGTKLFKYSTWSEASGSQLLRITKDKETSVEISAFEDVNVGVQACSTSKGEDISCVGPLLLKVPALTYEESSKGGDLQVKNKGWSEEVDPEQLAGEEEDQINSNPFSKLLQTIYSFYK